MGFEIQSKEWIPEGRDFYVKAVSGWKYAFKELVCRVGGILWNAPGREPDQIRQSPPDVEKPYAEGAVHCPRFLPV
jgi:hypothetical protein